MARLFLIACCAIAISVYSQKPKLKTVLPKIPTSIRGLSVVDDNVAWFSGSKGNVGRTLDGGKTWKFQPIKSFETVDFRSLYAFDSLHAIVANAGSPAHILKTSDGGKTWRTVYRNDDPDIFLDGIDFWDAKSGLIYGDPIHGKMVLLKTKNGGEKWKEIPAIHRPSLEKGEASFAASGTTIRCYKKNEVVIATGGMLSRLWISKDGGGNWSSIPAPIVQGKNSSGIFSIGVNANQFVIVGGDYVADSISTKNSFNSFDQGKNWAAPQSPTRGYRSCVEYITGKSWIAAGQRGLDITFDNGKNWEPLSDEKGLHVVRRARKGGKIIAAGNGKVVVIE
jgi:photosystem II stability/assembly factor-like uncharacterized protein